jgi:aspartyl-tRNA(Asn)/glutamyl-tRNA(Gln) amidotransferase subunit C
MALSVEEVEHIAELARLALSDEEKERFRTQLSAVLETASRLEELDTDEIHPAASILPLRNVMRSDQIHPPLSHEDALSNAPASEEGFFVVPAVQEPEPTPEPEG